MLEKEVPSGGTNMEALILALRDLNPSPDSVYIRPQTDYRQETIWNLGGRLVTKCPKT